ncbi:MAG: hypothetical protein V4654_15510 [Bdellovibrionota bacterium]
MTKIAGVLANSDDIEKSEFSKVQKFKPSKSEVEYRFQSRTDIRTNEGVSCKIILNNDISIANEFEVYDVSSFGICIRANATLAHLFVEKKNLELTVEFSGEFKFVTIGEVRWQTKDDSNADLIKVGIKYAYMNLDEAWDKSQVRVQEKYPLLGYIQRPILYSERAIVTITGISTTAISLTLIGADFLLFPDMDLKIIIAVQANVNSEIRIKVKNVVKLNSDRIVVQATISKINKRFCDNLVDFFLQSSEVSPASLKLAGFTPKNVSDNFRFRYVKTHEEYLEVLKLRFLSYQQAGKVTADAQPADMATIYDHKSRILVAYHGDLMVASCMISFPKTDDKLESEGYLENGYNFELPRRDNLLEIARLCTLNDYRGADLLKRMFEHIYKLMITSERAFIITSCDDKLWPLYYRLGFKKTGQFYLHKKLNNKRHDIIMVNRDVGIKSKMRNILVWFYLYANMTDYILLKKSASTNISTRIKLAVFKACSRIYKFLLRE